MDLEGDNAGAWPPTALFPGAFLTRFLALNAVGAVPATGPCDFVHQRGRESFPGVGPSPCQALTWPKPEVLLRPWGFSLPRT